MSNPQTVVVVGLGDVGMPLFELISKHYRAAGVDISRPAPEVDRVDVMHVCYPFQIENFVGEVTRHIEMFRPGLTIVNSTVPVGTTRTIAQRTSAAVVHSPVRGKHVRMREDLLRYTKFVGATDRVIAEQAARHWQAIGMNTRILSSPEATELAKLTETTYFGLLIAWAHEVERACDKAGQNYDEVTSFYEEIGYLPAVKYFPGIIGGHCVIPNIELLKQNEDSEILGAILSSNRKKIQRDAVLLLRDCAESSRPGSKAVMERQQPIGVADVQVGAETTAAPGPPIPPGLLPHPRRPQ
jgi:UDP-N-acetyl-D-mannosaminuronate dehydrogenase